MLCHQDKKRLKYHIIEDVMYQTPDGLMEVRVQRVYFTKQSAHKEPIILHAHMITYVDVTKHKLISLLTNDMKTAPPKS